MLAIIWKRSGSLGSKLASVKSQAASLHEQLTSAEQGAQTAVENMMAELGSIKALKNETAKLVQ